MQDYVGQAGVGVHSCPPACATGQHGSGAALQMQISGRTLLSRALEGIRE